VDHPERSRGTPRDGGAVVQGHQLPAVRADPGQPVLRRGHPQLRLRGDVAASRPGHEGAPVDHDRVRGDPGRRLSDHEPRLCGAEEPRRVVRRNGGTGTAFRRPLRLAQGLSARRGDRRTEATRHRRVGGRSRGGAMTSAAPAAGGPLSGGAGRPSPSAAVYHHIFPATGRPNATVALAGAPEIDRAVASAWAAQREWAALTVDRRRDLLIGLADVVGAHLDELAELNVHDYGVPISYAVICLQKKRFLRHFTGYVDQLHGSSTPANGSFDVNLGERAPHGRGGVTAPLNGALAVAGSCVAPALPAGNAVVFKPSDLAPLASLRFGELCLGAGLPAGLVNVVPAGPEGGDALVR